MDKFEVFKKAEEYAIDLTNTKLFNDLLEVKKKINIEFGELIKDFKYKREKFEQTKEYALYNDSIKNIQNEFQKVKEELYSKELVQKYFEIERKIQSELNDVAKKLASSISERFKK
ncbi:MAG: YlbF family regulator [bacterium]